MHSNSAPFLYISIDLRRKLVRVVNQLTAWHVSWPQLRSKYYKISGSRNFFTKINETTQIQGIITSLSMFRNVKRFSWARRISNWANSLTWAQSTKHTFGALGKKLHALWSTTAGHNIQITKCPAVYWFFFINLTLPGIYWGSPYDRFFVLRALTLQVGSVGCSVSNPSSMTNS